MPIASLNRFTVPLSGTQSAATQGLLMPKMKFRFRVTLDQFGVNGTPTTELTKQVMTVSRPELTFDDVTLDVYNSRVKLLGKHKWGDPKLKIRDDASGVVSKKIGEQLQKQFDFFEQSGAASGIDYKFRMRVEILDGGNGAFTPNVLETWELYGCYLKSANYNNVAYSANEAATIALSIKFDNAQQTAQGTGVGANVGWSGLSTLATGVK